jgi:Spy/CpxP family protein refolding chaperone
MKTFRKTLLTGLAALSMGAAALGAQAQTQAPQQNANRPHLTKEQREAKRAEFMAQRAAKLHADLGITSAQESAWSAFVASMKPAAGSYQHMDRSAWAGLTAPQRMQKAIDLQKQRTAQMEQRLAALNTFYSVLSPQQKQIFDAESAELAQHRFGHGGHGNWQHRGQPAQG